MSRIFVVLIVMMSLSCQDNNSSSEPISTVDLSEEQVEDLLDQYNFTYESPILLDSSDFILIPISAGSNWKSKHRMKSAKKARFLPNFWNALFYNQKTGETRILTEEKIRISKIHVDHQSRNRVGASIKDKILYQITDADFDANGELTDRDPELLFCSDLDGQNLQRISPENEELRTFKIIPNSNIVLIQTLRNGEGNKTFGPEDEAIWYRAEFVNEQWKLEEVIDSKGRKQIERLFFEQWLKKEAK